MKTKDIKSILLNSLEQNKKDNNEFNLIVEAAEKNKGQLNKHILKYLPEGCNYEIKHSMYYVIFPSKREHLLAWHNGQVQEINKTTLERSDSWACTGALERIKQLENFLLPGNFENLFKLFISLDKACKNLMKIYNEISFQKLDSFHNPVFYELLRFSNLEPKVFYLIEDLLKANRK